ncbi:MAG TPA: hypothetical protein VJ553_03900 [Candidatus Paceibacterota bacterium]|nr:hypothetical protein [Candidatus Paceibacterota bacterium]
MDIDPIIAKEMEIAERIFGTAQDPDQIPINRESLRKLMTLSPESIQHELDDKGDPIAWVVVVPTTRELMEQFLQGKLTERELFDRTEPHAEYDALYLSAAVTVPEHRLRGIARRLFRRAIERIPHAPDAVLFAWPTTDDGRAMAKALAGRFGIEVRLRQTP